MRWLYFNAFPPVVSFSTFALFFNNSLPETNLLTSSILAAASRSWVFHDRVVDGTLPNFFNFRLGKSFNVAKLLLCRLKHGKHSAKSSCFQFVDVRHIYPVSLQFVLEVVEEQTGFAQSPTISFTSPDSSSTTDGVAICLVIDFDCTSIAMLTSWN
eukprot:GHVN01018988.1.p1 GENE.GHVN01018988.1~~GHVN01018988.1.p1  ORF type:complete len:156 (-),score=13.62 GHVN01018988.1:788-1255(-)